MKRNILLVFLLVVLCGCTDFQDINTDIYGVTDQEYKMGGLAYGAPFLKMQQLVIPIGSPDEKTGPGNDLQNTDLISSGSYIGYFGNNNNWGFSLEASWNFPSHRMEYAYKNFYSKMFQQWQEINLLASKSEDPYDKQVLAMANIVKIAGWLRATDIFGPIVYSNAGKGEIAPKLDSQERVYQLMLQDLEKSVEVLKNASSKVLADYDLIYDGDTKKWTKLANSLMLRMAVRVHFKDESLAKQYIAKALDASNGGVITSLDEQAKIGSSAKKPLMNSMIPSVEEYGETRMGMTIWSYLDGYGDVRINQYFKAGEYGMSNGAIAPTNNQSKVTSYARQTAKPKIDNNTPLYWFRPSETYFLKAEAALYDLMTSENGADSAKKFYELGVTTSFAENSVSGAERYLSKTTLPSPSPRRYWYGPRYSDNISSGNVSPKWDDTKGNADIKERQLQKIITQKYIALYPNAVEAWTEYRRTGYPYIMKPADANAPGRIGCTDCRTPERFIYSANEYTSNPNMTEVPALLGGDDLGSTKLWWVRDNRPKQTAN